jgi:hypothetical protein
MKETTMNTGLAILEASANDTLAVDLTSASHVLIIDEYTKYFSMKCAGNSVARNLDTPAPAGSFTGKRVFVVENTGSSAITVRPGGLITGTVVVTSGQAALLKSDGTAITILSTGAVGGAFPFTGLDDVPSTYSGAGLKGVRVNTGATGLEFYSVPASLRFQQSGIPAASQKFNLVVDASVAFPVGLTGSKFFIGTNPTATMTFALNKIVAGTPTAIGTIAFSTSGVPTPTFASPVTLAAGDVLQIVAPGSPDATGADVGMSFKGTLQ